jgi:hypothetical protein
MTFHETTAHRVGHCDWCDRPIEVGQQISAMACDDLDDGRPRYGDTVWFHYACIRQFIAQASAQ